MSISSVVCSSKSELNLWHLSFLGGLFHQKRARHHQQMAQTHRCYHTDAPTTGRSRWSLWELQLWYQLLGYKGNIWDTRLTSVPSKLFPKHYPKVPKNQPLHNKYIRWCIGWYKYLGVLSERVSNFPFWGDDTAEQVLSRAPLLPGESLFEDKKRVGFFRKIRGVLGIASTFACLLWREMIWISDGRAFGEVWNW